MVQVLSQSLADAIDLCLRAKHSHWNVKGPNFIALHELFDKIAGEFDEHIDNIAERAVQLGGVAEGDLREVAARSAFQSYRPGSHSGVAYVAALSDSLAAFGSKLRANIDRAAAAGDADTADLFTTISRAVDKALWFVEAHEH
jgi:starvation-inducible DNA-binding protein